MKAVAVGVWLAAALALAGPAQAAIPLADFMRHREFGDVKISPAGEYVAIAAPSEGQTGLVVMRLADRKVTGSIRIGVRTHVSDFWWVGPDRVAFTLSMGTDELAQPAWTGALLAMNFDGSGVSTLYNYDYASMVEPITARPGHAVVSLTTGWVYRHSELPAKFALLDVLDGELKEIDAAPEDGDATFLADRQGHVRYAVVVDKDNRHRTWWRPDLKTRWRREDVGELSGATILPLKFATDGDAVFLASDEGGDRRCLVRRELDGERKRALLACHPVADLVRPVYSFDGRQPIAVEFAPGRPELQFLDVEHPDRKALEALNAAFAQKGEYVIPVSHSRDGSRLILFAYSDRNPGDYYLFDRATGKAEYLLSAREWIDPDQMAERRPISYRARDGRLIHGFLTLPRGVEARDLPLVVHPHGGPFDVRDRWGWDAEPQMLASRGYAVLQPNFRGSSGYGRAHRDAGRHAIGSAMIDDITDGTRWLLEQRIADPSRVCIYGASYGGYAALMSAVREPELYRCVVTYAGPFDLTSLDFRAFMRGGRRSRNFVEEYLGDTRASLKRQSPGTYLHRLKAAVLIAHGGKDEVVPIGHAHALRDALKDRDYPFDWMVQDDEGHGFYRASTRIAFAERLLSFLDRHIGRREPAAPFESRPGE